MTTRISAFVFDRPALTDVDRATWRVLGLSAMLFVAFTLYTTLLYRSFWLTGADFGSYVHMMWTTVNGEGFLLHGKYRPGQPDGSYWGAHFSLTLLAFVPLYALFPSPITLLVAKSFIVAASIPVLWFLARREIGDDRLAGLLTASYALNPFLWAAWVFDFQEQALLPLFVFGAYALYDRSRHLGFLLLLLLALFTNEFVAFLVAGALAGLALSAYREDRLRHAAPTLAAGFGLTALCYLLAGAVIDRFSREGGIPRGSVAPPLEPFVDGARAPVGDLVGVVLARPHLLVDLLTLDVFQKFAFLVLFFVPVLFVATTDEVTVGALAPFLCFAWLFAGRPIYYMFGAHYPFYLLPFVYIGAARVLGRYRPVGPSRPLLARLFVVVLVLNVAGAASVGAERQMLPETTDHDDTLHAAIDTIPEDATVLTQNDVYPHVAERSGATYVVDPGTFDQYQRAHGTVTPKYVLLDTRLDTGSIDWSRQVGTALGDRLGDEYGLYRYEDGVWIFQRGYDGPPRAITSDERVPPRPLPDEFRSTRNDGEVPEADPPWLGPVTDANGAAAAVSSRPVTAAELPTEPTIAVKSELTTAVKTEPTTAFGVRQ
ncbi:DUF2079 domain-containing protein [Halegenticoccus tardaugens]|uniref:DUF2079 domain-containing protein n=1 Tax=Halegenticoccus tardaugens TaxID=2071624 RepID=UPI00100C104A|nr:DUF2079 domain-containing protein [Halegenticoccus tardaugens]